MLQVRSEQLDPIRAKNRRAYIESVVDQFKRFFPAPTRVAGDEAVSRLVELGLERARSHGLRGEQSIVHYTTCMLLWGSSFDEDPQYAWEAKALHDRTLATEEERAEHLHDGFLDYWERVLSGRRDALVRTILRLRDETLEDVQARDRAATRAFLVDVWPQKAELLGEAVLEQLLDRSETIALKEGLDPTRSGCLLATLAYTAGTGFAEDPLCPWAGEALAASLDTSAKTRALFHAARLWAGQWIEAFAGEKGEEKP